MPETIEIAGHVADAASGLSVTGVQVEARAVIGRIQRPLARADTDAAGHFALRFERESDPVDARPDHDGPLRPIDPESPGPMPPREDSVHLVVLREEHPLRSPNGTLWDGSREVVLLVDLIPEPPPQPPPASESAAALTIAELGEALAATAASIQQELGHYPMANGAFLLDDLDVEIPGGFGVDSLGQLRVRVGSNLDAETTGRLRLRVKPLLETQEGRSPTAPQPLDSLGALSPEIIRRLEAERVFTVDDLLRVSRNPAGRRALEQLGVPNLATVRGRAEVIALPTLPPKISELLVQVGINAPDEFVAADPDSLAKRLEARLGEPLAPSDMAEWQKRTRPLVTLKRPISGE